MNSGPASERVGGCAGPGRTRGEETRTFAMRSSTAIFAALAVAACGGPQAESQRVMPSERLLACDTLLTELRTTSLGSASEPELAALLESADRNSEVCAQLWAEAATSSWEEQIAAHRSYQLPLQALLIEAALSERFDGHFGFCDIVDETFAMLFEGIAALEAALANPDIGHEDRLRAIELRDLDLEAVDVLLVTRTEQCAEDVGPD